MDDAPIAGPTYGERRFGPRWRHVAARWEQSVPRERRHRQLVLPDGCADVVVLDGTALLVGPTDRRDLVDIPGGTRIHGLRLRPGAIGAVLRVPAAELRDRVVRLDDVVGRRVARDLVGAARGDLGAALRLEGAGTARIREALGLLADGNGVESTARSVGLSERQLRREVLEHAGLGPKTMQRVFRLQRLLLLADRDGRADGLARLAADAGYADQAHLARDVRRLCGLTPRALLAHRATGDPATVGTVQDVRNVQELV